MTANKPMTGEQLDELMTVAVNMQRDAETDCNRPSAMFAYAVQVAILELRKVRNDAAALAAENAGLKGANAEGCKWDGEQWVGISIQTPATDAFLAEVRASAVDEVCLKISNAIINCHQDELVGLDEAATICGDFASELRKGAQS
ncbi:TPA: hypothetical protein ACR8QY_004287 [Enterobacter roggenkampii]|uniref:hypothetical protein n=1 Tax=Enterobacter roggenkampii TaxID=1812935 RepID=UPI003D6EB568